MAVTGVTRPAMVGLQVGVERPTVSGPAHGAVATELAQAVSAIEASDPVRLDPLRAAGVQPEIHDVILDAQSREVIFRAVEWSRRVTRQVPAVAARRLKAYADAAEQRTPHTGTQADTEL